MVVLPTAAAVGSTVTQMDWRLRYGVNLLAISREGGRSIQRLPSAPLAGGDVLLLQGRDDAIASLAGDLLGLSLEIVVVLVAVTMLLWVWPL